MVGEPVAGVSSARKLLRILMSFSAQSPSWTVPELASHLQLSQSTVYRYLALLRETDLAYVDDTGSYRLTVLVRSLADAAHGTEHRLADLAHGVMERVRDATDETVLLSQRIGWSAYCVERVESRSPVRLQFERGQAMGLHQGAMSRLLLASMSRLDRERYLASVDPADVAAHADLLSHEALDRAFADGFTESDGEIDQGIWGVASLVRTDAAALGVIGIAAPVFRTDAKKKRLIREQIHAAGAEISDRLKAEASAQRGN